ncbi:YcaO-like family protein [Acetomicrobium sp.]|jgi:YcaO-like protein with predicted kinase domain|uniref:YcaO-like family protein n=1 Tax=Acetomicrobium sp. TaxID=1872099 RepID=UPI00169A3312|nr:YcaO-like family protein [Clostridiales bacterium]
MSKSLGKALGKGKNGMKPPFVNIVPKDIEIELKDREIIFKETGSYTTLPTDTIVEAAGVLNKIGVDKIELINPRFTDNIPIFRLNEASVKAKCHRQACLWSPSPTLLNDPPRESFGKGVTLEQSLASAMMEAIERYCGQRFSHSKIINVSYEKVKDYALNPYEFNFPTVPLKCKNCASRDKDCFQELTNVCQEWSWGYSLIHKKPVLIPSALVYYPYISASGISFMFNDTGGLASGNTLEEAILQGISEVIERDALYYAYNLENLKNMYVIKFNNTKNSYIQNFINKALPHETIFSHHIKNENFNIGIPTISTFICYGQRKERRYFGGSGTNLDPEVALLRALTEMEQQKVRQKFLVELSPSYLIKHDGVGVKKCISIEKIPNQSTGYIKKDIGFCLDRLAKNNTDVIVVDLTHSDIGIPVVRIVIPKLISYSGSLIKESVMLDAMES